ncbi:MAG: ABC transporter permease [Sphaerochaetaceae bacterium]|jgi:simple sugar transport system permease protein|nr:ABC transporter permease [Sphaerochaetaceae bacterium]NLO60859.1 ABC transporter permease [Spirochaetales bacterium]MDD2406895.1 ABC transporter permease [Sphaerochaetaceae bacterium]MDD4259885.1 ABC transporter permease [Sphaerochaetaceae bacterium]MDD4840756.1 ABC transporter permease [Sphaerochaetaceae bacterium]
MMIRVERKQRKTITALSDSIGVMIIVCIACASIVLLALLLSNDPLKTLKYFFFGSFQSMCYLGNMINSAIPLIFGGLGVSLAMKAGLFNLGGEGQVYAGAFVASILVLVMAPFGIVGAILALLAAIGVSSLLAGISGMLKAAWNTNELITSFLVSNIVLLVVNYLIAGPFKDPNTNLIATRRIPPQFMLPKIMPPSNLSTALYFAIIAVMLVQIFLYRTKSGYELRMYGLNSTFAIYGGISRSRYQIGPMMLSGSLYGLAGALAIYGTYFTSIKEFSSGMGWNAIAVALIARFRPMAIIPAALFFAYIESGARNAMLHSDVTYEISSIVQAVVFLFVTSTVLQKGSIRTRRNL